MMPETQPIRVLVADDSPFMRAYVRRVLEQGGGARVVSVASSGHEVLKALAREPVDVVTLDIEMPGMDGIECLRHIMETHPVPVVMLSALTGRASSVTLEALALGAVDFVAKPDQPIAGVRPFAEELVAKVHAAAGVSPERLRRISPGGAREARARGTGQQAAVKRPSNEVASRVVAIGASTGGPHALEAVVRGLHPSLPAAVLITQHMPPGFTASLARRLGDIGTLKVYEGFEGAPLLDGVAYVAPGGFHLTISDERRLHLDDGPAVHHVRPAVDVMFRSAARKFGPATLGVVLTGMGRDGTDGARAIRQAGGRCVVQDAASCVVASMPESVVRAGQADGVCALAELPQSILRWTHDAGGMGERSTRRSGEAPP